VLVLLERLWGDPHPFKSSPNVEDLLHG
jgi:hypothetical protein